MRRLEKPDFLRIVEEVEHNMQKLEAFKKELGRYFREQRLRTRPACVRWLPKRSMRGAAGTIR